MIGISMEPLGLSSVEIGCLKEHEVALQASTLQASTLVFLETLATRKNGRNAPIVCRIRPLIIIGNYFLS